MKRIIMALFLYMNSCIYREIFGENRLDNLIL